MTAPNAKLSATADEARFQVLHAALYELYAVVHECANQLADRCVEAYKREGMIAPALQEWARELTAQVDGIVNAVEAVLGLKGTARTARHGYHDKNNSRTGTSSRGRIGTHAAEHSPTRRTPVDAGRLA